MSEADATPTRQQRVDHGPEHSQSINTGGEPFPVSGGIRHVLQTYATIAPFIVLVLSVLSVFVFAFIAGSRFFHPFNLSLIIQQVSIIGILAAEQSLIYLTAGIDLSNCGDRSI